MSDTATDAAIVWTAALEAVAPERLVASRLDAAGCTLTCDGRTVAAASPRGRVVVVGAGKAAAGLARGLLPLLARFPARLPVAGLVSVPEGCGSGPIDVDGGGRIELLATRPAAHNLPTPAAVAATEAMLALFDRLDPADLAFALVTGGGSACMSAPRAGLELREKIAVTRFLSAAGADIRALNVVRQAASRVKGGGLARACRAGRLVVLVLSDIIGDPLELVASGPCLPSPPRAGEALEILAAHGAIAAGVAPTLVRLLEEDLRSAAGARPHPDPAGPPAGRAAPPDWTTPHGCRVRHLLLGSNDSVVAAAAARAGALGYDVRVRRTEAAPGETAAGVGARLAREGASLHETARASRRPQALVEGGEAVVRVPAEHGRGGRNQHTAVAALAELWSTAGGWPPGLVVASVGTDGEDGPTTAAGGCIDLGVATRARAAGLDPAAALARCDTHTLLAAAGGLVVTGPTGTNLADLRLVLARP